MHDVVVVGAGPGGASAAYFLSQAGRRVLVLDKTLLPRYKACGGGLSTRMLQKYFPFSFESVIESRMRAIAYALGDKTVTVPLWDGSMAMVMRDRFDAHILAHSRADVRQATAVRSVTELGDRVIVEAADGRTFEARYAIGADGASSAVAKSLGLRRGKTLVAALEAEVPVAPAVLDRFRETPMFIFGEVRLGYAWIFPKSDHLSVGIAALRPGRGQLQPTLARVMARYGISLEGVPLHGHPIPVYTGRERISTARTLLIGDAAGLADPLSGEGIRLAIKSARLAAEAIVGDRPDRYPRLVLRHIGISEAMGWAVLGLFYHHTELCYWLGVRNAFATDAFMDLLSDRADYPEVILRLFGTVPAHLLLEGLAAAARRLGGPQREGQLRRSIYGAHAADR